MAAACETTATKLALSEGITKQAVQKQLKKFIDAGLMTSRRVGREVVFDVARFKELRAAHRDPNRAHLLQSPLGAPVDASAPPAPDLPPDPEPDAVPDAVAPAEDANAVRTPPLVATAAATDAARRAQAAKAEGAELNVAQQRFKLGKELGEYVSAAQAAAETQKLLAPLRALMMDGAPDLSRKLQGVEDERTRTQVIRSFFRDGLNDLAAKLREPDVGDSDRNPSGGRGADGP